MQYLNMSCPFCGGHRVATISKEFGDLFEYDSIVEYKCLDCGNNVEKVDSLYISCDNAWSVGTIKTVDPILENTLIIERCEKIKMHHKEMDIDFEFDTSKLENIDVIIVNGYKYVKDKYNNLDGEDDEQM